MKGIWTFITIGDSGTRVDLDIVFEVKSSLLGRAAGAAFEGIANEMLSNFVNEPMMFTPMLNISFCYPLPNEQKIITVPLPKGATVQDAMDATGILMHYPPQST